MSHNSYSEYNPVSSSAFAGEFNVDSLKGNVRELMSKIALAEKERSVLMNSIKNGSKKLHSFRDDALRQVDSLKRQNDGLLVNTVSLEQKLQKERERIFGSEEQLRKLEQKISISDINLATQVKLRTFPLSLARSLARFLSRKRFLSRQILRNDVIWSIITFAFIYFFLS